MESDTGALRPQNPAQNGHHHPRRHSPEQGLEYNALIDMTEDLCKSLPIKDLFPSMISLRVIDISDIDELCHNRTERKIVEKFIQSYLYPDLILGETSRFLNFIIAMRRSDKCDVLVGRLEERIRYHKMNVNFSGDANKDKSKAFILQPANKNMINVQITRGVCIISATLLCCLCLLLALLTFVSIIFTLLYFSGCVDLRIIINLQFPEIHSDSLTILQNFSILKDKKADVRSVKSMGSGRVSKKGTAIDFDKHESDETLAPLNLMVPNFTMKMKNKQQWLSDPFFASKGGYKMCLRVDAAGEGNDRGKHVSVFLQVMKGPSYNVVNQSGHNPVDGYVVIELISQAMVIPHNFRVLTLNNHSCSTCINEVNKSTGATWLGFSDFVSVESVHAYYLKDDSLHFRVSYSEHFWYIDAMLLYIPNVPAVLIFTVISSIVIYLMLISIEFVAFCTEEESNALIPSYSNFSIGSMKTFLLTKQSVLLSTWYVAMYSTVWEFLKYTLTVVVEVALIAVGELVLWDMSTASDNILPTIMAVQRISIVVVFSMIVNQYMMSWGEQIIMVHPLWLIRAYSYSVTNYSY